MPKKTKKILIVEDEKDLQRALIDKLEREGFKIISAYDGAEGLKMILKAKPDLILLDIIMPKLDGIALLKKMQADKNIKKIPVMLLTNLGGQEDIVKSIVSGKTDYLIKSNYSLDDVVKKINKILK